MARHRAPRFGFTYRHPHVADPPASEPPARVRALAQDPVQNVVRPLRPAERPAVALHYPDGDVVPVDWTDAGIQENRRRLVAVLPAAARLAHGMVIRVDDTVIAVTLARPLRNIGGLG
jgi:hypothetical protein